MIWFLLIVPGLAVAYFMFLRPILQGIPTFKEFFAEADGFWSKAWAVCGKSITMAWSYFLMLVGALFNQMDSIASALGDPGFKDQVSALVHADPKILGYFAMTVSAVTIAARLRSLSRG